VLVAAMAAGCGSDGGGTRPAAREELSVSTAGWRTDFSRHSVPLGEFRTGGPPRDGIPPIDHPRYLAITEAEGFLSDREPVLVVEEAGRARAYPIQILVWHEIVNDELAGRPIAVTYCPLCNSSVVFDRRVEGRALTFGTTGNLRRSDLVMWDRQTESWWQQLSADAVVGELTGTKLEVLPSQTLAWSAFKRRYPEGDVLSRDTGFDREYGKTPYEGYDDPDSPPFAFDEEADDRLPPKERVVAVFAGGDVVVVPFSRLERDPALETEVDGRPVVVLFERGVASALDEETIADSRDVGTAGAFERRIGDRVLDIERRGDRFVDRQTGSAWDITGRAVAGPLAGRRLRQLRHDEQFWFALAAFVPRARIEG
jgi:hypothetical protein